MLEFQTYYGHNFITRNLIVSFMDFFSKIQIEKFGTVSTSAGSNYVSRKIIPVPIQWAAREKWVEILRSSSARKAMDPAIREKNPIEMQWVLPRISVNLTGMSYDESRHLPKTQRLSNYIQSAPTSAKVDIYAPVPYNLNLELSVIGRQIDDNFQIMEQILPYFGPGLNLNVKLYPTKESESIPIILDSISHDIPTQLQEFEERFFTTTYNFTIKSNYYHQKITTGIIQNIDINFIDNIEVDQVTIDWIEAQQKIQTRFNHYVANADIPNPFL